MRNPDHVSKGVARIAVDGVDHDPQLPIPARPAGSEVRVVVTLGGHGPTREVA